MSARPHLERAEPARARAINGTPRPIHFPSRPAVEELCKTRANADNARWQAQVERRDALVMAAAAAGRQEGMRAGYTQGWRWGLVCGIVAGGLAVSLLWLGWAPVQAWLAS